MCQCTFFHKKGAKDILNNYRMLGIGCNISKVYLRVIHNRMTDVVEEDKLLGEYQNGFRTKRRATDNLFILRTIAEKYKIEKKQLYIALLDVRKAYDRVWREALWFKMRQMKFPEKLLRVLQSVYRQPMGKPSFQGVEAKPLGMPVGLRQGCVLSPILWSIFIADLGKIIEDSGFGISLNGKPAPIMMFADDFAVMEQKTNLIALLRLIGDYGNHWRIEFDGPKCRLLPMGRKPDPRVQWLICHKHMSDGSDRPIYIKEYDIGRLLGANLSRKGKLFKVQKKDNIKKLQFLAREVLTLS